MNSDSIKSNLYAKSNRKQPPFEGVRKYFQCGNENVPAAKSLGTT